MHGGGCVRGAAKDLEACAPVARDAARLRADLDRLPPAPETVSRRDRGLLRRARLGLRHADALGIDAARIGVTGEARAAGRRRAGAAGTRPRRIPARVPAPGSIRCSTIAPARVQPHPHAGESSSGMRPTTGAWLERVARSRRARRRKSPHAAAARATRLDGLPPAFLRRSARSTCSSTKISTTRSAASRGRADRTARAPRRRARFRHRARRARVRNGAPPQPRCTAPVPARMMKRRGRPKPPASRLAQPATLRTRRPARAPSLPSTRAHCGS